MTKLIDELHNLIGRDIEFTDEAGEWDGYEEKGMRATVTGVRENHDMVYLDIDYTKFDEYNKAYESANYYDKDNHPTRTAREAGFYQIKDHMVFDENMSLKDLHFKAINVEEENELVKMFLFECNMDTGVVIENSKAVFTLNGETFEISVKKTS